MGRRFYPCLVVLGLTAIALGGCSPASVAGTDSAAAPETISATVMPPVPEAVPAVLPTIDTPPGAIVTENFTATKFSRQPVLKDIAAELSYFDSETELAAWLASDDTDQWIFIDLTQNQADGTTTNYDCDDYALQLQRRALASGYIMSAAVIEVDGKPHMINSCIIDQKIYYIEPQNDKFWLFSSLD